MSGLRILRAADRRPQRWKNGGGITSEVAAFPSGAGIEDFDWRISIAEVAEAGPFSRFEGVDRVLTVIEGELALAFGDRPDPVLLTCASPPFAFAGDVPVSGAPLGGTVRDLNVMARRGKVAAIAERIVLRPGQRQRLDLPEHCVLVALGSVAVRIREEDHHLADMDALRVEIASSALAMACGDSRGLIVIALDHPAE